jgi:Family of unknown function (DUF5681)
MTDRSIASGDYDVGWGRPPHHSRFKKGQSGNQNGRTPKARNLKTDLVAELGARIRIREGYREVSISKQEAFIKTLVARALKGDARASSLLVGLMAKLLDVEVDLAERGVDTNEKAIIDAYVARRFAEDGIPSKSTSGARTDFGDPDDVGD